MARKRSNAPSIQPAANSTDSSVNLSVEPASYPQIPQTKRFSYRSRQLLRRASVIVSPDTGLYGPDGYPGVAPPWGTLNAINLNTGEYAWKIPLGEHTELGAKGMTNTGTENYGEPLVTAGGLLFISATNYDKKLRTSINQPARCSGKRSGLG